MEDEDANEDNNDEIIKNKVVEEIVCKVEEEEVKALNSNNKNLTGNIGRD